MLRWRIEGAARWWCPAFAGKGRADELWQTTCFELFLQAGWRGPTSSSTSRPSERWAAYDFAGYREGMRRAAMSRASRNARMRQGHSLAIFDATVPMAGLPPRPWTLRAVPR